VFVCTDELVVDWLAHGGGHMFVAMVFNGTNMPPLRRPIDNVEAEAKLEVSCGLLLSLDGLALLDEKDLQFVPPQQKQGFRKM